MSRTGPTVIDFGVDYITVTAQSKAASAALTSVGKNNLAIEAAAGNEVKPWRGLGYHGFFSGGVSFGVGPQGSLVRLSSGTAKEHWQEVWSCAEHCTRIDVQVTIAREQPPSAVLAKHWAIVRKEWLKRPTRKEPKMIAGPRGVQTLSLGSRQSERYGRIYDKFEETKLDHYRNAVRYEVELKGKRSQVFAGALARSPRALHSISSQVTGFFRKHSLELPVETYPYSHLSVPTNISDDSRRLRYLGTSVKPLVSGLISRGRLNECLEALGLVGFVDVNPDSLKITDD
jgi:hypothetical protein